MSDHSQVSQSSSQIIPWHDAVWQRINDQRNEDRLPHAILLSGEEGIGKQQFAQRLADSLLCHNPSEQGNPCGTCKSCHVMRSDAHPDFRTIGAPEGKVQIPVDSIRALTSFMALTRSYGRFRVAIISPADAMNINAANSLLKTLEEPPASTVIILVTSRPSLLLPTIRSRCRQVHIPTPSNQQAREWLQPHLSSESIDHLMVLSGGKPFLALSLGQDEVLQKSYHQLAEDLEKLLREQISITAFTSQWKKANIGLLLRWQLIWVMHIIKITSGAANESQLPSLLIKHSFQRLIPSFQQQWRLYDNLLQSSGWVESPLNQESFVEQIALYWLNARTPK